MSDQEIFGQQGAGLVPHMGERTELGIGNNGDPAYTLQRGHSHGVMTPAMHVRRLTPRECERLQGFPDDYTAISYGGRPAADSPRYKALGNSMAVPVMRWLGERIENRNVNLLGMTMEGLV